MIDYTGQIIFKLILFLLCFKYVYKIFTLNIKIVVHSVVRSLLTWIIWKEVTNSMYILYVKLKLTSIWIFVSDGKNNKIE